jgi:hypothetical protein
VLVFGWSTSIVTVTTGSDGSYTYTATAPLQPVRTMLTYSFLATTAAARSIYPVRQPP